jgi:hypothetical protein
MALRNIIALNSKTVYQPAPLCLQKSLPEEASFRLHPRSIPLQN